jgi:flagellar hook assembly protein FlgD
MQCDPSSSVAQDRHIFSPLLLRTFPNPSSRETAIHLEAFAPGLVRASVFGSSGRLVRSLYEGILGAGVHDLSWDGRDDEGHPVAAGVYLLRVSVAEQHGTARVVIAR